MKIELLQEQIEAIWIKKIQGEDFDKIKAISLSNEVIELLDNGYISVVEKNDNNEWFCNQWIKKAILLSFLRKNETINSGDTTNWFDKCVNKFTNWEFDSFQRAGIRVVPGCFVRKGAFFDKGCIIMPSFVNIGARVGKNTMIDSMTTIGSCCYIGEKCHISANVCIGGVLEPLQANPVIIEDNCFIGAGSQITEGTIIEKGSVIASGTIISSGVKIIDRATGNIFKGKIPSYSVVVGGSYRSKENPDININCAVIIKQINEEIREKTSINDLLR